MYNEEKMKILTFLTLRGHCTPKGLWGMGETYPTRYSPIHIPYTKKILVSFHFKIFGRWGGGGSGENINFLFF